MITEQQLEKLGLEGISRSANGAEIGAHCPFCDDGKPGHFSINAETELGHCFKCGWGGAFRSLASQLGKPVPVGPAGPDGPEAAAAREPPKVLSTEAQAALNDTAAYFHKRLGETDAAYLRQRMLSDEVVEKFQLGSADSGLVDYLLREKGHGQDACLEAGVLNENGETGRLRPYCMGAITIPVLAPCGEVETIVYRLADAYVKSGGPRYVALRGRPRGLFNRAAAEGAEEVWLTEGAMDAMTLAGIGFAAVALPSASTVKAEFSATFAGKKRVLVVTDNDEAGEKAREHLHRKLPGVPFIDVRLPEGVKDVNEWVVKHSATKAQIEALAAEAIQRAPNATAIGLSPGKLAPDVSGAADTVFQYPPFTFKADHFEVAADRTVKATLTVSKGGKPVHRDRVCLSLAKKRVEFANKCGSPAVDGHLIEIEQKLLALWQKQAAAREKESGKPAEKELSPEQKTAAMEFLNDPSLMDRLDKDLQTAGLVGERIAGQLVYLTATSRLLGRPLCVLIMAQSAAGKSYVGDMVIKLIPEDQVIDATSCSAQSLAHAGRDLLKHKLVRIAENVDTEDSETMAYYIRELLSRQKVERLMTVGSNETGFHTVKVVAEGPIAYVETTTKVKINEENQTRMFVLRIDESEAQTIRIHQAQRRARTLEGFAEDLRREEVIAQHHALQSLLQPVAVRIPYADYIQFPTKLRARRDHNRFLDLIEAVACLHQFQRKSTVMGERTVIDATFQDYRIAAEIAEYVLADTMGDLPGPSLELHVALVEASKAGKIDGEKFTVGDACAALGNEISESTVRRRLKPLLYSEAVLEVEEGNGKYGATYKLGRSTVQARKPLPSSGELIVKWGKATGLFPLKKRKPVLPACASNPETDNKGPCNHG
jgi:5S rRNA maturation endonuclease (ribonuclease M5)/DNA-binding transcriptional ArsR family regulator